MSSRLPAVCGHLVPDSSWKRDPGGGPRLEPRWLLSRSRRSWVCQAPSPPARTDWLRGHQAPCACPPPAEASPPAPSYSEELDLRLSRPFSLILRLSQCNPCKQCKVGSCQVSSFLTEPSDLALEVTVHMVWLISTMFGLVFCLGICSSSFWFLLSCHLWMNFKYVLVFHFINLKKTVLTI